jgi:hypothetical protein
MAPDAADQIFFGIAIAMFWDESGHQTPHLHAAYAG